MALKALKLDSEQPYDHVINAIRVELQVPMNRSLLQRIALEEYVSKRTSTNGKADLKAIAAPYAKVKAAADVEKAKEKLTEAEKKAKEYAKA